MAMAMSNPSREGSALIGKYRIALGCCTVFCGCATTNPLADQFNVPNPFGTLLSSKQEVLAAVPVGTQAHEARVVMHEHGFEQSQDRREDDRETLVFHTSDLARLRARTEDFWVTIYLRRGQVQDVEVWPKAPPSAPVGVRPPTPQAPGAGGA
jgi:hypothetical protein